jgi:hypothetical protein
VTTFAGSDTWHALIVGPDPADTVTADSVVDGDKLLADRTQYLYQRLDGVYAGIVDGSGYAGNGSTAIVQDVKASTSYIQVVTAPIVAPLEIGDIVTIRAQCHAYYTGASPEALEVIALLALDDGGPTFTPTGTGGGVQARMRDRGVYAPGDPIYCEARYTVTAAGQHRAALWARVTVASLDAVVHGPWSLSWRTDREVRP